MAGTEDTANNFLDALLLALDLITELNAGLIEIVSLSLSVSLSAVLIAASIGLPSEPLHRLQLPRTSNINRSPQRADGATSCLYRTHGLSPLISIWSPWGP